MDHKIIKADQDFKAWKDRCAELWQIVIGEIPKNVVFDPSLQEAYTIYKSGMSPEGYIRLYINWFL